MSMAQPVHRNSGEGSTLSTLVGVMNSAKEKWDSSGASEAMSSFSARIPDSTKDYISSTTGQLFSRDRLRSITVCFGIGEERPFYVEKNPALLIARVKHNLQFFYLNYLGLTAVLFCLTLLINPFAIIGIGLLAASWMYVIRATQSGSLKIGSLAISQTHATIGMGIVSAFVLFWLLSNIFWWTLASSGFMVVVHAGLRDASMHQDGEDQVMMVGEVAGSGSGGISSSEQASFLGDPQV